jgi:hypothetical protein
MLGTARPAAMLLTKDEARRIAANYFHATGAIEEADLVARTHVSLKRLAKLCRACCAETVPIGPTSLRPVGNSA